MSLWQQHQMEERVLAALDSVHLNSPQGHPFGRPFLSSYQLALALVEQDQGLPAALGKAVGGRGIGAHDSVAQYLASELSRQIRSSGGDHFAEGAFMSNERVRAIVFDGVDGSEIVSSLVGSDFDMAMFRLRVPDATT
jgi:hypothetical protein